MWLTPSTRTRVHRRGVIVGVHMSRLECGEITALLEQYARGQPEALAPLSEKVGAELDRIARRLTRFERNGRTQTASSLVQDLFLWIVRHPGRHYEDRQHFYLTAARVMQHVLTARHRIAGRMEPMPVQEMPSPHNVRTIDQVLEISLVLERMEQISLRATHLVRLRFFAGFTTDESAEMLGVSARTLRDDWKWAQGWLCAELGEKQSRRATCPTDHMKQ
jgi:RNA polymerase sigma-70 factor (ECF subfamily)